MKSKRGYIRTRVENLLKENVSARERSNRRRAICYEISKTHPEILFLEKEVFMSCVKMAISFDRMFRDVQLKDKNLRGSDYSQKRELEEDVMLELEYEPHYHTDIKLINKI